MEIKRTTFNEEEKDYKLICDSCGAENLDGAKNCSYCGKTLVTIVQTETEETMMSSEEIIDDILHGTNDFYHSSIEGLGRVTRERGSASGPHTAEEYERIQKNKKKSLILAIAIAVIGMLLLMGVFAISLIIGPMWSLAMNNAGQDAIETMSVLLNVMSIVRVVFLGIGFLAFCGGIVFLFRRVRSTTKIYSRQCKCCNGTNPAGSTVCKYCGNPLVEEHSETNTTDYVHRASQASARAMENLANFAYDMQDKYDQQHRDKQ